MLASIWDGRTGELLVRKIIGHDKYCHSSLVELSDSEFVKMDSLDAGNVSIHDMKTLGLVERLEGKHSSRIWQVEKLPNDMIISLSNEEMLMHDMKTKEELIRVKWVRPDAMRINVVSPHGNIVIAGRKLIQKWEINYGVSGLEQAFKDMSVEQFKKVLKQLSKLQKEEVSKTKARVKIKNILNIDPFVVPPNKENVEDNNNNEVG